MKQILSASHSYPYTHLIHLLLSTSTTTMRLSQDDVHQAETRAHRQHERISLPLLWECHLFSASHLPAHHQPKTPQQRIVPAGRVDGIK